MYPYVIEMLARENRQRIDEEFRQINLLIEARRRDPGLLEQLLVALGDRFIWAGLWLKDRYEQDLSGAREQELTS